MLTLILESRFNFTEREIHQTFGHSSQLATNRPEHVQKQLSSIVARSATRSEGDSRSAHQHHILQTEGFIQYFLFYQTPLNVITLCQVISDHINLMITITDRFCNFCIINKMVLMKTGDQKQAADNINHDYIHQATVFQFC